MDHLDRLAQTALNTIRGGYYAVSTQVPVPAPAFVPALAGSRGRLLVAEVKPASPSGGTLSRRDPQSVVEAYARAGPGGLSVLTEPVHFGGALDTLRHAARQGLPVLCKDFLLDPVQLEAASACGASAVLLILALFERGYAACPPEGMVQAAHERGLEVLIEVYNPSEYERALETSADMIGVNNRDLKTLNVDLATTESVLAGRRKDRPVWALSGIYTPQDVIRLRQAGADALLVGTALMRAADPARLVKRLLEAQ